MYILTILKNKSVVREIEYYEPPGNAEIEKQLKKGETFDIHRKPIGDEDIEQYLNGSEDEEI